MTPSRHRPNPRLVAAACLGGAVLDLLFWTRQFLAGSTDHAPQALVAAYEAAFPVADAVLCALLFVAGVNLWRDGARGRFPLICAASMAIYLGLLDVTFYSVHHLYLPLTTASAFEAFINVATLAGGALGLVYAWRSGGRDERATHR